MALQFKRGSTSTLAAYTPLSGEPLWATNTNELYVGDGVTPGGVLITGGGGGGGYTLPTASTSTLGGVKVDGTSILIDGSGVISAPAPGNPFDQDLNTTNTVTFNNLSISSATIALGSSASASNSGVALGPNANASGIATVALGLNATASQYGAAALGQMSSASGEYSNAVGSYATATAPFSIAMGVSATANNSRNIAIGAGAGYSSGSTVTNSSSTIIINASNDNLVAPDHSGFYVSPITNSTASNVLYYDTVTKEITYGTASIGNPFNQDLNTTDSPSFANLSVESQQIALGLGATSTGTGATAVGWNAKAAGDYSIKLGYHVGGDPLGEQSIGIGVAAGGAGTYTISIGHLAKASIDGSIVLNGGSTGLTAAERGFYVNPIRNTTSTQVLYYDTSTKEITYGPATGGGSSYDQALNTNDDVTFNSLTVAAENTLAADSTTGITTTASQTVYTFDPVFYSTAKLVIQIKDSGAFHSTEMLVVSDGTDVWSNEYSVVTSGSELATLSATISGGNVVVQVTPTSPTNMTVKVAATLIAV